ncbi:11527_t:CDS:2 [Ambispora gerdemannii]|uniref:11527_t:CDS:1 n=1 Tax=Ambispora gerdemannii TaxID=144530 RepID=A0A9N8ZHB7_9GLOM|nr:11527_t:CDS:2 [Ambispora gerdemannii]
MAELQQELRDLREQLKDARAEKEFFENKYSDAGESMEMMTLDKDGEAKAENLQHEVNILMEKIEEINVDLSVFKQEGDLMNRTKTNVDRRTAVEVIQLERQNERLKEALVRTKQYEKELVSLQDIHGMEVISTYINEKQDSKEELLISGLQQLIYKITEHILGSNEMNIWEGCTNSLQGLCLEVGSLNNCRMIVSGLSQVKNIKAKVLVNLDMEHQFLQEAQVKIDLQEKHMELIKNQADTIAILEEQLTSSRRQQ